MGNDIYGSELISGEADVLRIENLTWKIPLGLQLSLALVRYGTFSCPRVPDMIRTQTQHFFHWSLEVIDLRTSAMVAIAALSIQAARAEPAPQYRLATGDVIEITAISAPDIHSQA